MSREVKESPGLTAMPNLGVSQIYSITVTSSEHDCHFIRCNISASNKFSPRLVETSTTNMGSGIITHENTEITNGCTKMYDMSFQYIVSMPLGQTKFYSKWYVGSYWLQTALSRYIMHVFSWSQKIAREESWRFSTLPLKIQWILQNPVCIESLSSCVTL